MSVKPRSFYLYEMDGRLQLQGSMFDAELAEECAISGRRLKLPLRGGRSIVIRAQVGDSRYPTPYAVVSFEIEEGEANNGKA